MAIYSDDEMLMLSGIQHYVFCPRQWALIHLEQQWAENRLTAEGRLLHDHVDDPTYRQMHGKIITLRAVPIASRQLGIYGLTDAIELHPVASSDNAIVQPKRSGYWQPVPIEYKHGHPKTNSCDEMHLTAQVLCLEEMYDINIPTAELFYGETHHRKVVAITEELRSNSILTIQNMHQLFQTGRMPKAVRAPHCRNCSLKDICMPQLSTLPSVSSYLQNDLYLYEETT